MTSRSVSVVVIAYNDAAHVADAVRSALAQGPAVAEVIAVDDASTDATAAVLERLAAREPRLRLLRHPVNSGGCGTPRNTGLAAARGRYVMFLDSDDLLPPGAAAALLTAATRHDAPVTAGRCVRRELPAGTERPWQPALFEAPAAPAVYDPPRRHPELVHDTLCVNKLYERDFLRAHRITFPEGRFPYEDFVFTARVLAAAPRLAVIADPVYVWQVRRRSAALSISLDRGRIEHWAGRLEAHRQAVDVLRTAGAERLAAAARTKFLDHDLPLYIRELPSRGAEFQRWWWSLTRAHLAAFAPAERAAARPAHRWLTALLLASPAPRELARMAALTAAPPRLLPPLATSGGRPVWSADLPDLPLEGLDHLPLEALPLTVDAELAGPGAYPVLRLRVHELYGRLAAADIYGVDVELWHRERGRLGQRRSVALFPDGTGWVASPRLDLTALPATDAALAVWDIRAGIRCARGRTVVTGVRPVGAAPRRTVLPSRRHGLLLVQPYTTSHGALALRVAPGVRGATGVATARLHRMLKN
ncbi:glycosyltransferase [Streptomyces xiamenensis]|uniref:glycosyltransferase n=1 Tax=Streptomyces xiamenensis TaxID=408015 RepID=UPI0036AC5702